MMMHSRYGLLLVWLLVSGCRDSRPAAPPVGSAAEASRPVVVATIYPLADLLRRLAGPDAEVHCLLPPGASAHTFEITPQAAMALNGARLIARIGPGADSWLDAVMPQPAPRVVTALEHTKTIAGVPCEEDHDHAAHDHRHGDPAGADPHVWLDPIRVRDDLLPALVAGLREVLPTSAAGLTGRQAELAKELTALDAELRRTLAPVRGDGFIAGHNAWQYFCQRYGLQQVGVIELVPGTDPSAKWMKELTATARAKQARAVFGEMQLNAALADTLAKETGLRVGRLDPYGGAALAGRDSYPALLRYNAAELVKGLQP
ncbi:MAG: zinc ABC transporter substrate-binding protein [Fimbriimonadaceae bacterium]|nr:zinc ABC transporter substrate-binding protein [Fimbriimonadaceae bacterium]